MRFLAVLILTILLALPGLSVELFRYCAATTDGGRRTPEEVERDNSWLIPHPEECVPLNMIEACEKL
jgi:hypothetical protein